MRTPLARRAPGLAALVLLLAACGTASPGSGASTPSPTASSTAASPSPSAIADPPLMQAAMRVSSPGCGYGGSATAASMFLDVEALADVHGVTARFELDDPATGALRGASEGEVMLLVSPEARGTLDFSTQGTTPWDGTLARGARVRLQVFGGVHEVAPLTGPMRIVVTLVDDAGLRVEASCTTEEMWPSS